ncbi:DUF445 domain-containing protein [Zymobacter palmae]|uniref:Predicted membrane protein n=1 Tax=Zymobacter palmae TaxID=33074 RepID=A0A348HES6_9GAMM|nr:DUF445 domain-containing protein [Zymobacter palmae]BBG30128.1 predicted membrane protein [Zymobacter palmae]
MPHSNPKPTGSWLARHRGGVALCCSLVGFVLAEVASHFRLLPEDLLTLVRAFFEGALVGSLADWFAVTAIFHYIPIPLLARHTHLLARKRASMTEGIADMVQNRWLSPAAIRTWLDRVSFCDLLAGYLFAKQGGMTRLETFSQRGLSFLAHHVTHSSVTLMLCRFWQRTLHRCPLPKKLTPWLLRMLRHPGMEDQLYQRMACLIEMLQRHPRIMASVSTSLANQLQLSATSSTWARTRLWIGKRFLKGDDDADKLRYLLEKALTGLQQQLLDMAEDPHHPTRRIVRRQLFLAVRKADHNGQSAQLVETIWQRVLPVLTHADTAEQMAHRIQNELSSLMTNDMHLQKTIHAFVSHQVRLLLVEPARRQFWDEYLRIQCVGLLERYPHVVGNIVRESLSPARMSTDQMVKQIEDKVGQEMQWIRVNGAVVGGLVATGLALLRLAISALG